MGIGVVVEELGEANDLGIATTTELQHATAAIIFEASTTTKLFHASAT